MMQDAGSGIADYTRGLELRVHICVCVCVFMFMYMCYVSICDSGECAIHKHRDEIYTCDMTHCL
jgi:hypothetical protein